MTIEIRAFWHGTPDKEFTVEKVYEGTNGGVAINEAQRIAKVEGVRLVNVVDPQYPDKVHIAVHGKGSNMGELA
jgi:hypothetical protein